MTVPTRGKAPTFNIYLLYHNITLPKSQPISAAKREAHADGENGTWRFDVPPLYDEKSRVLILGSFPSVKSREAAFFYAHPQNRFWPTLAAVLGEETPKTVKEKKAMALRRGVAMWDTIGSCEIVGSSDASITNVVPNDLSVILDAADIQAIFCNGGTSYACYKKYCRAKLGREAVQLPSTSPANARWTKEKLIEAWGAALKPYLF